MELILDIIMFQEKENQKIKIIQKKLITQMNVVCINHENYLYEKRRILSQYFR